MQIAATGPVPSDTVFVRAFAGEFDGVLALYHDQAFIPLKLVGREADLDEPPSMRTFVGELSAVYRHRTEARLGRLRLPTLLVRPGGHILIDPKQTDRLAERIPNATVIRFEDAGHGVTFHKARELNAALLDHFDAADRRDSHPSTDTNHSHHA